MNGFVRQHSEPVAVRHSIPTVNVLPEKERHETA
jgi:hypothetical protein